MTENFIKERLSRAYAVAVSAAEGVACEFYDNDYGLDGSFNEVKYNTTRKKYRSTGYGIDFQLKSTVSAVFSGGKVIYDLEVKNYKDLIETDVGRPRILILYVMPSDKSEWLNIATSETTMKKCAYWCSLKGKPDTTNTSRIRIEIPESQMLTPDELGKLMRAMKGGLL